MKLSQMPTLVADYTIGTLIVMTFLSTAERRTLRAERQSGVRGERLGYRGRA
ncbi:MAG TPA: hypothetical protein VML75_13885 [Kofleriaceae bacterium]|nr:hypothetical protein [Kofleriaceae bacterium]